LARSRAQTVVAKTTNEIIERHRHVAERGCLTPFTLARSRAQTVVAKTTNEIIERHRHVAERGCPTLFTLVTCNSEAGNPEPKSPTTTFKFVDL
jgi:hypothetical protein